MVANRSALSVLLLAVLGLTLTSCSDCDRSIQMFMANVRAVLADSGEAERLVETPSESGSVVLVSPYSALNAELLLSERLGADVAKRITETSYPFGAFYLFVVTTRGEVYSEKWEEPPVVFNGVFVQEFKPSDSALVFHVRDFSLTGLKPGMARKNNS